MPGAAWALNFAGAECSISGLPKSRLKNLLVGKMSHGYLMQFGLEHARQ
jgi:hypothetical protein